MLLLSEFALGRVGGVKQFVGSVAADFAEILVIKLFDLGVFVGFALCLAGVLGIKRLGAQLLNIEIHEILGTDNARFLHRTAQIVEKVCF